MMGVFDDPKEAARETRQQFGERAEGEVKATGADRDSSQTTPGDSHSDRD
jgi:hypothetical protein